MRGRVVGARGGVLCGRQCCGGGIVLCGDGVLWEGWCAMCEGVGAV